MPRRRKAWAAWNYITRTSRSSPTSASHSPTSAVSDSTSPIESVSLTYNMNILQHIPTSIYGDVLVTLNPIHAPSPSTIQGSWHYRHPLYTAAAVRAQKALPRIQNRRGISFAGAWTKYGFHEDGFSSGVAAALQHLGGAVEWEFVDSTFSRGRRPRLGVPDYALRAAIGAVRWWAWAVALWWVVVTLPARVLMRVLGGVLVLVLGSGGKRRKLA